MPMISGCLVAIHRAIQHHGGRLLCGVLLAGLLPVAAAGQPPADYFRQNCMSCHTIGGGRLTGPDLKGVTERREREWLLKFVQNPRAMIESGDPQARALFEEYRGVLMPTPPRITPEMAAALLELIDAESKLAQSQFAGLSISDRPFTVFDVVQGRDIFLGRRRLANDGPSCVACHSLSGLSGLGGGQLGPELTRVYERLGDRKAVGSWLSAPATPTMQSLYGSKALQPEEILALLAYLEETERHAPAPSSDGPLRFLLLGLAGTAAGLMVLGALWRRRFRSVRRRLVQGARSWQ